MLCIEVPLEGFTEATLGNLERLVLSKASLIKKAIAADALPIERTETTLRFPWFSVDITSDEVQTYALFIERLCTTAKERKRIMAIEREVFVTPNSVPSQSSKNSSISIHFPSVFIVMAPLSTVLYILLPTVSNRSNNSL